MPNQRNLILALTFWVVTSLLFMAAMSIGLAVFALVSLFVLWHARQEWSQSFKAALSSDGFLWASIALVAWSLFSFVYALAFPPLGIPVSSFLELKKFQYFLYPFVVAAALWYLPAASRGKWQVYFLGIAAFVGVLGVLQYWAVTIFPVSWIEGNSFFRPMSHSDGVIADHFHAQGLMKFHLSYATAMFFPLSMALANLVWGQKPQQRLWWFVFSLLLSVAIFYSFSRASWIALGILFLQLALMTRPKLMLLVLVLLGAISYGAWQNSESFRIRLATDPMGINGRMIVWRSALEMIKDRPLVGVGFGQTGHYSGAYGQRFFGEKQWFVSHAHNNFLEVLSSTGIPGFIAFLTWWYILFVYAWRAFKGQDPLAKIWGASFLLAGVAFQVNGLTQVNFFDAKSQHVLIFWVGLMLFLGLQQKSVKSGAN